jgi:general secretion pathway protein E/type IV pilus assembly protein PilB
LGVGADTLQSLTAGPELQVLDADKEDDLDLANAAQDASIIRFVNQILTEAIESRATDVHIEPFEDALRLPLPHRRRARRGQRARLRPRFHAAIVSRIKILSHLDIAEKRLPQDGRIKLKISGREIDVPRVDHPDDPRRGRRAAYPRPRRHAAGHGAHRNGRARP